MLHQEFKVLPCKTMQKKKMQVNGCDLSILSDKNEMFATRNWSEIVLTTRKKIIYPREKDRKLFKCPFFPLT